MQSPEETPPKNSHLCDPILQAIAMYYPRIPASVGVSLPPMCLSISELLQHTLGDGSSLNQIKGKHQSVSQSPGPDSQTKQKGHQELSTEP